MKAEEVLFTKGMTIVSEVTWDAAHNEGWLQSGVLFELKAGVLQDRGNHCLSQMFSDG